jgi:hypothetical protein
VSRGVTVVIPQVFNGGLLSIGFGSFTVVFLLSQLVFLRNCKRRKGGENRNYLPGLE